MGCIVTPDVLCCVLQADVYSLGVSLWECVERRRPFEGLDGMQLWTMWVSDPQAVTLPPLTVDGRAGQRGSCLAASRASRGW